MLIRPFTLLCVLFSGMSGMMLYAQKYKTTTLDHEIAKIVVDTQNIQSQTAVLRTEWALLNQPDRLRNLSEQILPQLQPLQPSQFVQMSALVQKLPAPQKEPLQNNTRDKIGAVVAANHGQTYTPVKNQPALDDNTDLGDKDTRQTIASNTNPSKISVQNSHKISKKAPIQMASLSNTSKMTIEEDTVDLPLSSKIHQTDQLEESSPSIKPLKIKSSSERRKNVIKSAPTTEIEDDLSRNLTDNHPKLARVNKTKKVSPSAPSNLVADNTPMPSYRRISTPIWHENSHRRSNQNIRLISAKSQHRNESALSNHADEALPAPVPFQ